MKIFVRKAIISVTALAIAFSVILVGAPKALALDDPDIKSQAALLVESTTGQILYSKNADAQRAPASLTKVMTVMLAIEAYNAGQVELNDIVTISNTAYADISSDGSTAGLLAGEQIEFHDLLYCAMLASANEACNALAEYISGDRDSFVELMNQRAQELGCKNTHFTNTHGMPDDNHYSTAYDLYLITANALSYPLFNEIVSAASYTVPATNLSEPRELTSTNFLIRPESRYYYEYASGVKTGHTEAAGYCLISTASNEDRHMISVVLGAESVVIEDGTTQVQSFSETVRLFNWGFDNFSYREVLSTTDLVTEVPVDLAKGRSSLVLCPENSISVLLSNDADLSQVELSYTVNSTENGTSLMAPIDQGTVLGSVSVSLDGVEYGSAALVANTAVELDRFAYIKYEIGRTLSNTFVRIIIFLLFLLLAAYIAFIIIYNKNRRKRKTAADAYARKRVEELRRGEGATTGSTFEEIEAMRREKDEKTSKIFDLIRRHTTSSNKKNSGNVDHDTEDMSKR